MKMKKVIVVLAFIAANLGMAQSVSFGGKLGGNLATLTGDVSNSKMMTGFHAGGAVEVELSEGFSIQPELLFSMQGGEVSKSIDFLNASARVKVANNYISLPVMGKFYVTEGLSIEAGPQLNYLISSKASTTVSVYNVALLTRKSDIRQRSNKLDFGFNAGLGYKLPSGVSFGARYNLGLSNTNNSSEAISIKTIDDVSVAAILGNGVIKNSVIQVSVGYFF